MVALYWLAVAVAAVGLALFIWWEAFKAGLQWVYRKLFH